MKAMPPLVIAYISNSTSVVATSPLGKEVEGAIKISVAVVIDVDVDVNPPLIRDLRSKFQAPDLREKWIC